MMLDQRLVPILDRAVLDAQIIWVPVAIPAIRIAGDRQFQERQRSGAQPAGRVHVVWGRNGAAPVGPLARQVEARDGERPLAEAKFVEHLESSVIRGENARSE